MRGAGAEEKGVMGKKVSSCDLRVITSKPAATQAPSEVEGG